MGYVRVYLPRLTQGALIGKFLNGDEVHDIEWVEVDFLGGSTYQLEGYYIKFYNCNVTAVMQRDCKYYNSVVNIVALNHASPGRGYFYSSVVYASFGARGFYIYGDKSIIVNTGGLGWGSNLTNSCVPIDSGLGNLTNFAANPQFNREDLKDYTLNGDSKCLTKQELVGRYGRGFASDINSSIFSENLGAVYSKTGGINDLQAISTSDGGVAIAALKLRDGLTQGTVETTWIDLYSVKAIKRLNLLANIITDASGEIKEDFNGGATIDWVCTGKFSADESGKATAVWENIVWGSIINKTARFVKILITINRAI